jgi:hypothetical protein
MAMKAAGGDSSEPELNGPELLLLGNAKRF